MKIIATTLFGLALGATGAVSAAGAAAPALQSLPVQIRHQTAGCHTWSANGSPFRAALSVKLARGGKLSITDNDVMPHQLVRLSGPRVAYSLVNPGSMMGGSMMGTLKAPYASGMMPHPGAVLRVTFARAGVYTFRTAAGEDYMKGVKTTGEDNVLKLVVTVR
jgi:hypothetical protein